MADRPTTPLTTTYLLRVAADEIDYLEQRNLLRFPHVARFFDRPAAQFVLSHIQNFCWTTERAWGRIRRRPVPAEAVRPRFERPVQPAGIRYDAPPRVWIDVTVTHRMGFGGGIGRVAMQLAKAGQETGLAIPVIIEDGKVRPYFRDAQGPDELHFSNDTIFVLVDSFWEGLDEYVAICGKAKAAGARVVTCIHDVIPLYYPSLVRGGFADIFAKSFAAIMRQSDGCVTVSRHTSRQVQSYVGMLQPERPVPTAAFHLGSDGHAVAADAPVRESIRTMFAQRNVFLGVGTLEPRKGYAIALDAFDHVWARGGNCSYVIIGRPGWVSKALERRILAHPHYGTKLHWLRDADDAELTFAYGRAHCLIQASITEGFGLPIVEANREGTPVIASDTEIFRELAGPNLTYFRNCDSLDLAAKVEAAMRNRPLALPLDTPTWKESLVQMLRAINATLGEHPLAESEPMVPDLVTAACDRRSRRISRRPARLRLVSNRARYR